jgi:hypothetical protein
MNIDLVEILLTKVIVVAACSYIALSEQIALKVERDQYPDSKIKLPLLKEDRPFDILLDYKAKASQLSLLLLFGVCLSYSLRGFFLFIFTCTRNSRSGSLLRSRIASNSEPRDVIIIYQDLTKLFKCLEYVNASPSV